ncbi:MAG: hypothetical protein QE263_08615 [Vampirovibrionales bacterium]|nr:hypothetical protein [Vampirovibrionales bacterium]
MSITSAFRRVPSPAAKQHLCYTGQTLVEWSLLLALIGITCVASLSQLGQGVSGTLSDVNDSLMGNLVGAPMSP